MQLISIRNRPIAIWLFVMCLAIICVIFIGGLTRLTDSGLSITEWKPITGILPPLNEQDWQAEFRKYQHSPEYIKINNGMNLSAFKSIFLIEFIHRQAGRIVGILYLLPLIYFLFNKKIQGKEIFIYIFGGILLAGQGFAGWYMVKSGLALEPHVSHFRLAIHLLLAILLYALLFWQMMKNCIGTIPANTGQNYCLLNICLNISLVFLLIQIVFGAFVAGLEAGLVYNSFPLMGDSLIPAEIKFYRLNLACFSDPVFVQFIHRTLALVLTFAITSVYVAGYRKQDPLLNKTLLSVMFALALQLASGILTLVNLVPVALALSHQMGAIILLSCLLWAKYLATKLGRQDDRIYS